MSEWLPSLQNVALLRARLLALQLLGLPLLQLFFQLFFFLAFEQAANARLTPLSHSSQLMRGAFDRGGALP